MNMYQFEDEEIVEEHGLLDLFAMMVQVGAPQPSYFEIYCYRLLELHVGWDLDGQLFASNYSANREKLCYI
jgi:hypothetical protein